MFLAFRKNSTQFAVQVQKNRTRGWRVAAYEWENPALKRDRDENSSEQITGFDLAQKLL